MVDMNFILNNIHLILTGGSIVVIPIVIALKIKLDKITNFNDMYFPSVAKYQKQFKEHANLLSEQVKKPTTNKKGW